MEPKYTKKDVARYFANKLDRTQRRAIEMACKTNVQVERWFRELSPTDEELEHESVTQVNAESPEYRHIAVRTFQSVEQDEGLSPMAELFAPESELTCQKERVLLIKTWANGILAADRYGRLPDDMPTLDIGALHGLDKLSNRNESRLQAAAKSETTEEEPTASKDIEPLPEPPYTCVRHNVLLSKQKSADVPFALARVLALRDGKPFRTKNVVMNFDAETNLWTLNLSLERFYEGDLPDGEPEYCLVPANEQSVSWFPITEVTRMRDDLPVIWTVERDRLSGFVELLKSFSNEATHG